MASEVVVPIPALVLCAGILYRKIHQLIGNAKVESSLSCLGIAAVKRIDADLVFDLHCDNGALLLVNFLDSFHHFDKSTLISLDAGIAEGRYLGGDHAVKPHCHPVFFGIRLDPLGHIGNVRVLGKAEPEDDEVKTACAYPSYQFLYN